MAAGVRYRYKGKFISRADAARIGNLPRASKYLTSQYVAKGEAGREYKGYRRPVAVEVRAALSLERARAAERRRLAAEVSPQKHAALERAAREREKETRRASETARRIAVYADQADMSPEEAMDALGVSDAGYAHYTADDLIGMAADFLDEGELYYGFDLADLEEDEKYGE